MDEPTPDPPIPGSGEVRALELQASGQKMLEQYQQSKDVQHLTEASKILCQGMELTAAGSDLHRSLNLHLCSACLESLDAISWNADLLQLTHQKLWEFAFESGLDNQNPIYYRCVMELSYSYLLSFKLHRTQDELVNATNLAERCWGDCPDDHPGRAFVDQRMGSSLQVWLACAICIGISFEAIIS
jgi:hypothetical protein